MTAIPKVTAKFETVLAGNVAVADGSFTVESNADKDGNALSGLYGFVLDEGTDDEEFCVGTISGTTVTTTKRGCDYDSPETEVTANKKKHRRGNSVKITDYPILAYLRHMLAGEAGYELPALLKYASSVGSPTDDKHLVNKLYVDGILAGGTGIPNRIVVGGNAGETISAAGKFVYFDDTDNEWKLTDADDPTKCENVLLGIAQGAGTDGNAIANGVLLIGLDSNQTGLTAGTPYYISNTAGALSSSPGTKEVSIGFAKSTTELYFKPRFNQNLTEDEQDALAGGGNFGTPSSANKFATQDFLSSPAVNTPILRKLTANVPVGSSTTRFDVTNISGNTYRYTYDGTGTDPVINSGTFPIGTVVDIQGQNLASGNKGLFVITGVGSNYFEISNASGVAENDKTLGTGYLVKGGVWTKPAGLKYITIEQCGAGGAGEGFTSASDTVVAGGSSGGYSKKFVILASALAATINYVVGYKVIGDGTANASLGGRTVFNHSSPIITTGGAGQTSPGTASGGDIDMPGQNGGGAIGNASGADLSGAGASTLLGLGGLGRSNSGDGNDAVGYGAGGGGAANTGGAATRSGGDSSDGIILLTEYYQ